jgi:hypothetical protein
MRFVKNDQRIRAEQACLIGPHLARNTIALEQKSRADHVDRTDNDRRHTGIIKPFAVVDMLATQGRNWESAVQPKQFLQMICICFECSAQLLGFCSRLVDHRPSIDDVDQAARNRFERAFLRKGSREHPDR